MHIFYFKFHKKIVNGISNTRTMQHTFELVIISFLAIISILIGIFCLEKCLNTGNHKKINFNAVV